MSKVKHKHPTRDAFGMFTDTNLHVDTDGKVVHKDGLALEDYLNHPSTCKARLELHMALEDLILVTMDAYNIAAITTMCA